MSSGVHSVCTDALTSGFSAALGTSAAAASAAACATCGGREVTFTSLSGPTPFVSRYLVEADSDATQLTLRGTISGARLTGPAALLEPLAEGVFKRGMRDNLGALKEILER